MPRLLLLLLLSITTGLVAGASDQPQPATLDALDRDIRAGAYGNIDHIVVMRGDTVLVNHKYARDYAAISRGRTSPIGCGDGCIDPAWLHEFNYFHPRTHPYFEGRRVHSLQSVTKSIAATVVGIAHARGAIKSLQQPFLDYFPGFDHTKADPRLRTVTIEDVLTMRSGIEWHEQDRPLDDTNTTIQLERSRDWLAFTLQQPMDAAPGTKWAYNSGGSMLLSGIVKAATGRFIDDYAHEFLFEPLGIRDFYWKKTPTGHPDTEGGLYLTAEELARIGRLYIAKGRWNGRQIVSADFISAATTRYVASVAPGWDYGYQWWLTKRGAGGQGRIDLDVWAGRGFGGQLLIVIPALDVVGVVNAWNVFPYDASRDGARPRGLQNQFID